MKEMTNFNFNNNLKIKTMFICLQAEGELKF